MPLDWFLEKFEVTEKQLKDGAYHAIKSLIAERHIRVVHIFDKDYSFGGITVAYEPVKFDPKTGFPVGIFAKVAVAYCNTKDRYCRKTGQAIAVNRLVNDQSVLLPIYSNSTPVKNIKAIFTDVCDYWW